MSASQLTGAQVGPQSSARRTKMGHGRRSSFLNPSHEGGGGSESHVRVVINTGGCAAGGVVPCAQSASGSGGGTDLPNI
jgi:hypothetical protein